MKPQFVTQNVLISFSPEHQPPSGNNAQPSEGNCSICLIPTILPGFPPRQSLGVSGEESHGLTAMEGGNEFQSLLSCQATTLVSESIVGPALGTRCLCSGWSGSLSFLSSVRPRVPSLLIPLTTEHPHDADSPTISPGPGDPTQPLMCTNCFRIVMNPLAGPLALHQASTPSRSPRLDEESRDTLLWLTLPCTAVAYKSPKQGAPPHILGVPPCWSNASALWGKARGANISAHICLSPPPASLFLQSSTNRGCKFPLLALSSSVHTADSWLILCGGFLLSTVRESPSRLMDMQERKLCVWNTSEK